MKLINNETININEISEELGISVNTLKKWIYDNKLLYDIKEASKFLDINPETLRKWERKGIILPERTEGNIRKYTKQSLLKIEFDTKKACDFLGVHKATLRKWESENKIKPEVSKGNIKRYSKESLIKFKFENFINEIHFINDKCKNIMEEALERCIIAENSNTNLLVGIKEASEHLGVNQETLRNWEKKGLITPDRLHGNRKFSEKLIRECELLVSENRKIRK